ncbi:MAG: Thiamine-monophosphate kinase [Rhodanobacteraceae bacterium]|jgi:thiamine-monophosphate kinase|nr:MAG: Thiamine-monophosphate kinase [Rhodanobacteraceae bacterium]
MEFDLIEVIRARVDAARDDVALGIGDDAALLDVPAGRQLVACTDTLVAGVHFPRDTAPDDIGWKALAVNLSDLAAMGAAPAWALLALTLPQADSGFVERFADGFAELARAHDVALVGGDTTQGPLAITVTALGWVPRGTALVRAGARVGDAVFVTGTLGDAAGALRLLRNPKESHPPRFPFLRKGEDELHPLPQEGRSRANARASAGRAAAGGCETTTMLARLHRPQPRVAAGLALRGIASACIDVSDGLIADLGHICAASGVGAEIEADGLPISQELAASFDAQTCCEFALAGGDDYELCFAASAEREAEITAMLERAGCDVTRIGRIVAGSGVRVLDARGNEVTPPRAGWEHFSR